MELDRNDPELLKKYNDQYLINKRLTELEEIRNSKIKNYDRILASMFLIAVSCFCSVLYMISNLMFGRDLHYAYLELCVSIIFILTVSSIYFKRFFQVPEVEKEYNELKSKEIKEYLHIEEYIDDYYRLYLSKKKSLEIKEYNTEAINILIEHKKNIQKTFNDSHDNYISVLNIESLLEEKKEKENLFFKNFGKAAFISGIGILSTIVLTKLDIFFSLDSFKLTMLIIMCFYISAFLYFVYRTALNDEKVAELKKGMESELKRVKDFEFYKTFYRNEILKLSKDELEGINPVFIEKILNAQNKDTKETILNRVKENEIVEKIYLENN